MSKNPRNPDRKSHGFSQSPRRNSRPRPVQSALKSFKPAPERPAESPARLDEAVVGRRPVLEALKSGAVIDRVLIRLGSTGTIIGEIIELCRQNDIRIDRLTPDVFDKKFDHKTSAGIAAFTAAAKTISLQEMLSLPRQNRLPLIVLLDGVEDPHNLGAIARSAEAAGALALILPGRRIAPLSQTALKASAGALSHLPIVRVSNMASTMEELKKAGFWIYGADMSGDDYRSVVFNTPAALVIGAEGKGMTRLVKDRCDKLLGIPLRGKTESLNASVSAGILIFRFAAIITE